MMTQTSKRPIAAQKSCCPDLEGLLDPALFKALGYPNRVALFARLGRMGRAATVTEAAECCPVDLSVVSRHLSVLRRAGVVQAAKHGREVHYSVSHHRLAATLRSLADALEACCPAEDGADDPAPPDGGNP